MKIKDLKARWMVDIKDSEIQRNLIWSDQFKIELLESVLSNQPVGAITLFDENGKQHFEIIDGKQRIYALEAFWKGELSFNDKYLHNLTDSQQEKFWDYELIIQQSKGSFEDKVKLFNKINKNLIPLKPFELLRAQFYGEFILGLSEFVQTDKNIIQVLKTNLRGDNEMIILDILCQNQSINEFLNTNKNNNFTKFMKEPKTIFAFINDVFSSYPNLKVLIELAKEYQSHKSELKQSHWELNVDIYQLNHQPHLVGWNKLSEYERILDKYLIQKDPKRIFSKDVKQLLWQDKMICPLCLQEIESIDKAEIDHIIPWSKGGTTELSNAQLVHKLCNIKKSNK